MGQLSSCGFDEFIIVAEAPTVPLWLDHIARRTVSSSAFLVMFAGTALLFRCKRQLTISFFYHIYLKVIELAACALVLLIHIITMRRCACVAGPLLASLWLFQAKAFAPVSSRRAVSCFHFPGPPSIGLPVPPASIKSGTTATTEAEQPADALGEEPRPAENNNNDDAPPENEHNEFLKDALLQSVLFTSLPEESLQALIEAFERVEFQKKGDVIYRQGDTCENDYVYVVGKGGQCLVEVDGKAVPPPYGILRSKTIFGELGVMYNQTRAATVSCRTPAVTLFRIPCDDFKNILNQRIITAADNGDGGDDAEQLEAIDNVIKEIEGTKTLYEGAIIKPYKPNRLWLWRQFLGTILQHVAIPMLANMLWSACFIVWARHRTLGGGWWSGAGLGLPPDATHPLIAKLHMVHKIWSYQQGLTTFILTFFLNQAFGFWREIYDIGRRIQGRLNDFHVILASTAARDKGDGSYTAQAESLLDDVGQYSRLFHALLWAANARRFRVLLTPRGLERMATRGLLTSKQLDVLQNLDLPEDQKHSACLQWMMVRTDRSIQDGSLVSVCLCEIETPSLLPSSSSLVLFYSSY